MTPEERKAYMKKYYAENKARINRRKRARRELYKRRKETEHDNS